MTEFEKMRSEEFYDFTSEECLASYFRAKHLCAKLQTMAVGNPCRVIRKTNDVKR
jgi:maltose O-acetyltransferase